MILGSITALAVIACDKHEAFAQGSDSDEAIQTFLVASGLLRFARNDDSASIHHALVVAVRG